MNTLKLSNMKGNKTAPFFQVLQSKRGQQRGGGWKEGGGGGKLDFAATKTASSRAAAGNIPTTATFAAAAAVWAAACWAGEQQDITYLKLLDEKQHIARHYLTLIDEQQDIVNHHLTFDITCWTASAAAAASSTTSGSQTEAIRVSTTSSVAFPWPRSGPCACPEEGECSITNDDCTKLTMQLLLRGWIPIHLHPDQ